ALDQQWIPDKPDHSLYIRPFMFGMDETLGVHPSTTYKFMIILSPTGPYYAKPMRIYVEEKYTRAAPGGVGYVKAAGNYASALLATTEAQKKGYDQVLWTDAFTHKTVQEIGTMNVFFIIGNKAITPGLHSETILAGVTRDTAITLLKEMGLTVEERDIQIDEVVAAYQSQQLREVFGTGTAATISKIRELRYKDQVMEFDVDSWTLCTEVKRRLDAIRSFQAPDPHGWMFKV
ncbi:MAG: aminotransferase class IV, partial [Chitinophagaceae bacterium]